MFSSLPLLSHMIPKHHILARTSNPSNLQLRLPLRDLLAPQLLRHLFLQLSDFELSHKSEDIMGVFLLSEVEVEAGLVEFVLVEG